MISRKPSVVKPVRGGRSHEHSVDPMAAKCDAGATGLGSLSDAQALHRPAPGTWSIKEIVGHRLINFDELSWRPGPRTEPATLGYLIEDYVGPLEHHLAQARRVAEHSTW